MIYKRWSNTSSEIEIVALWFPFLKKWVFWLQMKLRMWKWEVRTAHVGIKVWVGCF